MIGWKRLEIESSPWPDKKIPPVGPECWDDEPTDNKDNIRLLKAFYLCVAIALIIFFVGVPIIATIFHKPAEPKFNPAQTLESRLDAWQAQKVNK